jgi:tetratricopeptide (TPR) repeat protein
MKLSLKTEILVLACLLTAGFASVFFLSNRLEISKPQLPEQYEDEDLSLQGQRLKGYSLGFEGLIADWYWMRSLQYIGNKFVKNTEERISLDDLTPLNPRLLYPLLDNATTLDPQFLAVYDYGATVLPAIDPDQAIKLVEKGIRNNPKEWRLYHFLGFIEWRLKKYDKAAAAYDKGSEIPGSPPFMKLMAARMRSDAGSRDTARLIYKRIYDQTRDSQTKENARLRLLQMDYFDERDVIREALKEFRARNGRCPASWKEVTPLLLNRKLPGVREFRIDANGDLVDPSDAPYVFDDNDKGCDVGLDRTKTKIPLK